MQLSQLLDKQCPGGEGCPGISMQLGLPFATLSIISCYSYSVRNCHITGCLPLEMDYLRITKEWMGLMLWSPASVFYHTSPLPQVENPENPSEAHWSYMSCTLPLSYSAPAALALLLFPLTQGFVTCWPLYLDRSSPREPQGSLLHLLQAIVQISLPCPPFLQL